MSSLKKIGISEYRDIVSGIKAGYGIDFTNYALSSLKRRIEKFMNYHNILNHDAFLEKLLIDKPFFEIFLRDISVETTEMFRDPQTWKEIKEKIILKHKYDNLKIWVPQITSDDELFTLLVIIDETEAVEATEIIATSHSQKNLEQAAEGIVDLKKIDQTKLNYQQYDSSKSIENFLKIDNKKAAIKKNLLKNVKFIKHNFFKDPPPANDFRLILFRNRLLYFNPVLHCQAIDIIYKSLLPGGYLAIGVNETVDICPGKEKFSLISKTEKIYKRLVL